MYFMLCFQKVFNRTKHEKMESLFHSTVGNEITFLPFVCLAIVCLCRFLCIFLFYVSAVFQKSVYYCLLFLSDFSFSFCHSFSPLNSPEGRPGMSDVSPLSGISGLSFDFTLLSPLLFFCLVLLPFLSYRFLSAGPFF